MRTCYQRNVVERCGCGDPGYPLDGSSFVNSTHPCSYYNSVQRIKLLPYSLIIIIIIIRMIRIVH